jgi:DNA-3-methyladenine glycosylase I
VIGAERMAEANQHSSALAAAVQRCFWVVPDPLLVAYHDQEWGVPCHNDGELFERLMLEVNQAGLAWVTILRKRENFRLAFDCWDPEKIAAYDEREIERLMGDAGIVRNRMKIEAAITNAKAFLDIQQQEGSFDEYVWSFVGGEPICHPGLTPSTIPAFTPQSTALSKDLKRRGFRFVGTTICYAFMQSVGMADDHLPACFKYRG